MADRLGINISKIGEVVLSKETKDKPLSLVNIELRLKGHKFELTDSKGYLHF